MVGVTGSLPSFVTMSIKTPCLWTELKPSWIPDGLLIESTSARDIYTHYYIIKDVII